MGYNGKELSAIFHDALEFFGQTGTTERLKCHHLATSTIIYSWPEKQFSSKKLMQTTCWHKIILSPKTQCHSLQYPDIFKDAYSCNIPKLMRMKNNVSAKGRGINRLTETDKNALWPNRHIQLAWATIALINVSYILQCNKNNRFLAIVHHSTSRLLRSVRRGASIWFRVVAFANDIRLTVRHLVCIFVWDQVVWGRSCSQKPHSSGRCFRCSDTDQREICAGKLQCTPEGSSGFTSMEGQLAETLCQSQNICTITRLITWQKNSG